MIKVTTMKKILLLSALLVFLSPFWSFAHDCEIKDYAVIKDMSTGELTKQFDLFKSLYDHNFIFYKKYSDMGYHNKARSLLDEAGICKAEMDKIDLVLKQREKKN